MSIYDWQLLLHVDVFSMFSSHPFFFDIQFRCFDEVAQFILSGADGRWEWGDFDGGLSLIKVKLMVSDG